MSRIRVFAFLTFAGCFLLHPAPAASPGRLCLPDDTWDNGVLDDGTPGGPVGRVDHTAIWTGTEMIVWGGTNGGSALATGDRYDPVLDLWTPTSTVGAPSARSEHVAVWTGTEMIVWGGVPPGEPGGRYDPLLDAWTPMSTVGAPSTSFDRHAVWTGSEMIVWGASGFPGSLANEGARYDPLTDSWSPMSFLDAPAARMQATAVWTGTEMIVQGGRSAEDVAAIFGDGGRYDPVLDQWTAIPFEAYRFDHTAVWTGSTMIVWGGCAGPFDLNSGGIYDPLTNSWAEMSRDIPLPQDGRRDLHTAVWTGSEMVVWGGTPGPGAGSLLDNGARYDPASDEWAAISQSGAPTHRAEHTAVWTGDVMIVWGGIDEPVGTGGRYSVDLDHDGTCNAQDPCPQDPLDDQDDDGLCADVDNCPADANPAQVDSDADGAGDACDNCLGLFNPDQADADADGAGDLCDTCTDTDGDGYGNPGFPLNDCEVDNCPDVANPDQADDDLDGQGDACDSCPGDPVNDIDFDGWCTTQDNCPAEYNPYQLDADGDGIGDECDECTDTDGDGFGDPAFPAISCVADSCLPVANPSQVDGDGDGLGNACDTCPSTSNPEQDAIVSNVPLKGLLPVVSVHEFEISASGAHVVFIDDTGVAREDLYSVPTAGGITLQLTDNAHTITGFEISPDSSTVVFRGDHDTGAVREVYSVPIGGGPLTKLNDPLPESGDVVDSAISPDGTRVVYRAEQEADGIFELYSVPIDGGVVVKLNDVLVDSGDVREFEISADSARVVFRADQETDGVDELFSVPLGGGTAVKLNDVMVASGDVSIFGISPDSAWVVYVADQNVDGRTELFSVPIGGGTVNPLGVTVGSEYVVDFAVTPDSQTVVYKEKQASTGGWLLLNLFSVPIGGGTPTAVHAAPLSVHTYRITPDGAAVVFRALEDLTPPRRLFIAPLPGGPESALFGPSVSGETEEDLVVTGDGKLVVYRADHDTEDVIGLYVVPTTGGVPVRLNPEPVSGGDVLAFAVGPEGSRVAYLADQETDGQAELYSVRLGGSAALKLNDPILTPGGEVEDFRIGPDGDFVAYNAFQQATGRFEPFGVSFEPDSDGDGVLDSCDCAVLDPATFARPPEVAHLRFESSQDLVWDSGAPDSGTGTVHDLLYGDTGELPLTAASVAECLQAGLAANTWNAPEEPASSEVYFYLVRATNSCGRGTYGYDSSWVERRHRACDN